MFSAYGPVEGRRHYRTFLSFSGLENVLAAYMNLKGFQFHICGDIAHIMRHYLQRAFHEAGARAAQGKFNSIMGASRVPVEYNCKYLKQQCSRNDYARFLKVSLAPVALIQVASVLLQNRRTCLLRQGETI